MAGERERAEALERIEGEEPGGHVLGRGEERPRVRRPLDAQHVVEVTRVLAVLDHGRKLAREMRRRPPDLRVRAARGEDVAPIRRELDVAHCPVSRVVERGHGPGFLKLKRCRTVPRRKLTITARPSTSIAISTLPSGLSASRAMSRGVWNGSVRDVDVVRSKTATWLPTGEMSELPSVKRTLPLR